MAEKGLIKFKQGGHWYGRDGEPDHDATLREARKKILYPSVTTIDRDVFKNDFLDRWKMNQLVVAACDNPKGHEEPVDHYANRLYDLSLNKSKTASEFGTKIHDALDKYPAAPEPELLPWYDSFAEWHDKNVTIRIASEGVMLDHDIGVAGRTDLIAQMTGYGLAVIDYKTQDVKTDSKGRKTPNFYDSWARQLAFYAACHAKSTNSYPALPTCVSVVIDSNIDAVIHAKVWDSEEIREAYEDFVLGAYQWFKKRSYWPVGRWRVNPSQPYFSR